MPLKKGHLGIVTLSKEATTLEASKEEGYDEVDCLLVEADLDAGQASVTWLGTEGFARIFHKGSSDPQELSPGKLLDVCVNMLGHKQDQSHSSSDDAGMEGILKVGDRLDLKGVTDLSAPLSKSTYMLMGTKSSAHTPAGGSR